MESWITDAPGPRTEQAPDLPPRSGDANPSALLPHQPGPEDDLDDLDDLIHIPAVQRLRTEVAVLRAQLFAAELIASERAERIADLRLVLAALRDVRQGEPARERVEPVVAVPEPPVAEALDAPSPIVVDPPAPPPGEGSGWIDWEPPGRTPEPEEPDESEATDIAVPTAIPQGPVPTSPEPAAAMPPSPNGDDVPTPRRRVWWRRRRL